MGEWDGDRMQYQCHRLEYESVLCSGPLEACEDALFDGIPFTDYERKGLFLRTVMVFQNSSYFQCLEE